MYIIEYFHHISYSRYLYTWTDLAVQEVSHIQSLMSVLRKFSNVNSGLISVGGHWFFAPLLARLYQSTGRAIAYSSNHGVGVAQNVKVFG